MATTTILKHIVTENNKALDYIMCSVYVNSDFKYELKVLRSANNTDFKIGHIVLETQIFFNYKSPDNFDISIENFNTIEEANVFFEKWKTRFEIQGYYSSTHYGRIPLNMLNDFCELFTIYP